MFGFSRLGAARRGSALVEFAFVAPVLLLLSTAVYDYGTVMWRRMQVSNAARAGAAFAATSGWNATSIADAVRGATGFSEIQAEPAPSQFCGCAGSSGVIATTCGSPCPGGDVARGYVSVNSSATYRYVFPLPGRSPTSTLRASTVARLP